MLPGADRVVWLEAIAHVAVVPGTAATTVLVEMAPACSAGALQGPSGQIQVSRRDAVQDGGLATEAGSRIVVQPPVAADDRAAAGNCALAASARGSVATTTAYGKRGFMTRIMRYATARAAVNRIWLPPRSPQWRRSCGPQVGAVTPSPAIIVLLKEVPGKASAFHSCTVSADSLPVVQPADCPPILPRS